MIDGSMAMPNLDAQAMPDLRKRSCARLRPASLKFFFAERTGSLDGSIDELAVIIGRKKMTRFPLFVASH